MLSACRWTRGLWVGWYVLNDRPFEAVPLDTPPSGMFDVIFHGLDACSQDLIGPMRPRLLVIPVRDDAGVVVGGFWGCTVFQWLHVQLLFIPAPLRGSGVGTALMATAEAEAANRGCIGAHVTSFSFQATPFYRKLGYTLFGQLDDYPPGHNLLYLRKRFAFPERAGEQPTSCALPRPSHAAAREAITAAGC